VVLVGGDHAVRVGGGQHEAARGVERLRDCVLEGVCGGTGDGETDRVGRVGGGGGVSVGIDRGDRPAGRVVAGLGEWIGGERGGGVVGGLPQHGDVAAGRG